MFSPNLGRFLQNDPKGFNAGDTNLYRYVGNNPANMLDPHGLEEQSSVTQPINVGDLNIGQFNCHVGKNVHGKPAMFFNFVPERRKRIQRTPLEWAAGWAGVSHFNFYQIVIKDSERTVYVKGGKVYLCSPPYVDAPPGGWPDSEKELKIGAPYNGDIIWSDNHPWYLDEVQPPAGKASGCGCVSRKGDNLEADDQPGQGKVVFRTWLVGIGEGGKTVTFFAGVQWTWENGNVTGIKPIGKPDIDKEYIGPCKEVGFQVIPTPK